MLITDLRYSLWLKLLVIVYKSFYDKLHFILWFNLLVFVFQIYWWNKPWLVMVYSCFNGLHNFICFYYSCYFPSIIINEISFCFSLSVLSLLIYSTSIHSWIRKLLLFFIDYIKHWVDNVKITYSLKFWNNIS